MAKTHLVKPGKPVTLADITTRAKGFCDDKNAARDEFRELRDKFIEWQRRLYAEGKQKLLIVLQAMDAGGKDGTIRNILEGVNPQGVRVASFKAPSKRELAHDFLWRIHKAVPPAGHITVFNRSHYEDVLVVRVEDIVPETVWRPRYEIINNFEEALHLSGTHILKFYLHISKEEQMERFQDRLDEPDKNWKFDSGDLEKRKNWDAYQEAFAEMLEHCSTPHNPWHIIPSDQKWYRNLAVMRIIIDKMREMDPKYPTTDFDPKTILIE